MTSNHIDELIDQEYSEKKNCMEPFPPFNIWGTECHAKQSYTAKIKHTRPQCINLKFNWQG